MTFEEWEATVPELIKVDRIWRVQAYRLAAFLGACAGDDTREIADDPRFRLTAAQLCRAGASIAANIAEGYPRQSPKDRVRYYEYALGSAEEAKTWYLSLRDSLAPNALDERLSTLRSISRLLLTMIRSSRPAKRPPLSSPP